MKSNFALVKTCWLHKRVAAFNAGSLSQLPSTTRRHLESCPACRRAAESSERIGRALASSARSETVAPGRPLHARVVANLARPSAPEPAPRLFAGWGMAVGACASLALAAWLGYGSRLSPWGEAKSRVGSDSAAVPVALAYFAPGEKWLEAAKRLDDPLEKEMESLLADTKSAFKTLAHNFVPEDFSR